MKWFKDFIGRVKDKIIDHLAAVVASGIIAIIVILCAIFLEWLKAEHSLEMFGFLWFFVSLVFLAFLIYSLYSVSHHLVKIKEPDDIRNILSKWWRHCTDQCPQKEFTLYFAAIDRKEKLKKGSAKKYLSEIITKDEEWSIVRTGHETIQVRKKHRPKIRDRRVISRDRL